MNSIFKRISTLLLVLILMVSALPASVTASPASSKIYTTPTGYTSASDVDYVKSGNTIANWGARGEDCLFLSSYAEDYYTGDYDFDTLSALPGGSSQSNASSSALYGELQDLMESTHSFYTYYDGNKNVRSYYKYTDCVSNDTSKVALLYRGGLETSSWNSGKIWNQEHVWPQSKLSSSQQIGDIMHLRPANPSENTSRNNTAYGEGSGYYDPGVSVRGDCARMVLYMYVRWGKSNTWGSSGVMQNVDVLLDWMEEDPVDTWEMGRNDAVQSITGVRNVFVDYPEFAWLLFGQDVPEGITTPSDNDGVSANPGGNNNNNNNNTSTPATQPATKPATQPTTKPATQPATKPATQPSTQTTQPSTSTAPSTGTTNPVTSTPPSSNSTPAPMATNSVPAPTLPKGNDESNPNSWILIVILVAIALIGGGVAVYFLVIRPKKATPVTEPETEEEPTDNNEKHKICPDAMHPCISIFYTNR